jgi:O-antigen/teichoic acid export membrane protein
MTLAADHSSQTGRTGSSIRRSFALSFAQRYSDLIVRLIGTMVLARLLSPHDFGVFAVASASIGILLVIAEFGLDAFLVQERDLTPATLGTAFSFALTAHGVIAALILAAGLLSPPWLIAPALADVLVILSASFALGPFGLLITARLYREMRFGLLYTVQSMRAVAAVATAIILAYGGYGAASLAGATVAEAVVMALVALCLARQYPLPAPRLSSWRATLDFGLTASAINVLKRCGDAAPRIALGTMIGYGAAGLFSRAQAVVTLFDRGVLQAITPVVLPLLAQKRRQGGSLAAVYLKKVAYVSALAWPFFLFVILFPRSILEVVLGPGWAPAALTVQLLAVAGLLLPIVQLNQKFFVALDRQRAYLRVQVIDQASKIGLVVLLCVADFRLVALAFVLENALKAALTYPTLRRHLGYGSAEFRSALWASVPTTSGALAVPLLLAAFWSAPPILMLAAAGSAAAAGWVIAVIWSKHPIADELARVTHRLKTWKRSGWFGRAREGS